MTITHVAPGWRADPGARDLLTFDDWWRLPADWVEPPNFRRGGWSAVSRLTLPGPTGEAETLYVKRQVAQFRRTPATGGRLRPTYFHEFQALSWSPTLPVVDWVCYAERGDQAILVTRAPRGFVPLSVLAGRMPGAHLACALVSVGAALAVLHRRRLQHGACYPDHILVDPITLRVRLLDLERWRRRLTVAAAARSDLDQLLRRAPFLDQAGRDSLLRTAGLYAPGLKLPAPRAPDGIPDYV
ncbi:lipopolysaccharide kinase InaA family protein [Alloalcanivorax sp. C16-2]|uniref:lipopolysaccharide kinase InaA family protein n=1 Tax=Alloalcanivorax sp. C16-2 TaxID=3390052 RepID=UPI0039710E8D|nr:lipopolysaccharide kinase InaA family protein [Alcanivorax sp.]